MNKNICKNIGIIISIVFLLSNIFIIYPLERVEAGSYDGEDLALAILSNASWLIDSSYSDKDEYGHSQAAVLSSLGIMSPTNGPTFALFSTGKAGVSIITTDEEEPGDERGTYFEGGTVGYPRDQATLTMDLQVPTYMHYLYYDVQFFSSEYPEYVGTQFNDKLTITVNSPSEGVSEYIFDVNSGYFVLDSVGISGTGFDIFAGSGNPDGVDLVDTTQRIPGADAGASDLIPIGGIYHPVSPNEEITVTIDITDVGDNLFDSAAFIDNLRFSGWAKTEIVARKSVYDEDNELINGEEIDSDETLKYKITISNTGAADQHDNDGNEFEDILPENTTYVTSSATATFGTISYNSGQNKIVWNGEVPGESSCILEFKVTIDNGIDSGTILSNQGSVYWDSDEDGTNDAIELTDDPYYDDGIDLDEDEDTDDDDPTYVIVVAFECPSIVTEDFSDDTAGGKATQSYISRDWFETGEGRLGSVFEVISSIDYLTDNSYKSKIRKSGSPQYWNYTLSELESDMVWWEIWFACGDACEEYDLNLNLKNDLGIDIAKIRFQYVHEGTNLPTDWLLKLYYWDPNSEWCQLSSDFGGGYLRNSWYQLRIEKNGANYIDYSLNRSGVGMVDFGTGTKLGPNFENFAQVEWSSSKDPDAIVCPMFFWDDHSLGLIEVS